MGKNIKISDFVQEANKKAKEQKSSIKPIKADKKKQTEWLDTGFISDPNTIIEIPLDQIYEKEQVRKNYDEEKLFSLAQNIKSEGLKQPIEVMRDNAGKFFVVFGHRRFKAMQMAGIKTARCMITHISEEEKLLDQLSENLNREDLSTIDEAEGYENLIKHFKMKQATIASKFGKSKTYISRTLSILKLKDKVARAQLYDIPRRSLVELASIAEREDFFDIYNKAKNCKNSDEIRDLIRKVKEKKEKSSKDLDEFKANILKFQEQVHDKVLKFSIAHRDKFTPEFEDALKVEMAKSLEPLVQSINTHFPGSGRISVTLKLEDDSEIESATPETSSVIQSDTTGEQVCYPGTDIALSISKVLSKSKYKLVKYSSTSSTVLEVIGNIAKLNTTELNRLEKFDNDRVIDIWNHLPFSDLRSIKGFLFSALKNDDFNFTSRYEDFKEKVTTAE